MAQSMYDWLDFWSNCFSRNSLVHTNCAKTTWTIGSFTHRVHIRFWLRGSGNNAKKKIFFRAISTILSYHTISYGCRIQFLLVITVCLHAGWLLWHIFVYMPSWTFPIYAFSEGCRVRSLLVGAVASGISLELWPTFVHMRHTHWHFVEAWHGR